MTFEPTPTARTASVDQRYLLAAARATRSIKSHSHSALGVRAGDRVLDVGCGTGIDLAMLAAAGYDATGVDSDRDRLAEASQAVAGHSTHLVCADATSLPFRSASFDASRAERLLQHVAEPGLVVCELARVTRPGGRVVLIDTDWASLSISSRNLDVERAIVAGLLRFCARHPTAGRDLLRYVPAETLRVLDLSVHGLFTRDIAELRTLVHLTAAEQYSLRSGRVTEAALEEWRQDLAAQAGTGDLFATVNVVMVSAERRAV